MEWTVLFWCILLAFRGELKAKSSLSTLEKELKINCNKLFTLVLAKK